MNLKKGNINIENSTCEKLLAVKVDNKLNFNEQLDGKASRTVTLSRFMAILFLSLVFRIAYCYVICNRNAANMDVVALYLSDQLNNNFILYTREINFSVHIYIFCPPSF